MKRHGTGISGAVIFASLLFAAGSSFGAELNKTRVGVHAAHSMGGDIEESDTGMGFQAEFPMSGNISLELAVSRFDDEYQDAGISLAQELTTFGVSALYRAPLSEVANVYFLGGLNYNTTDVDVSLDPAMFVPGTSITTDIDDAVGIHLGFGAEYKVTSNWALFAEYRYTLLDVEGTVTASAGSLSASESIEGDYDFGLLKAGISYLF